MMFSHVYKKRYLGVSLYVSPHRAPFSNDITLLRLDAPWRTPRLAIGFTASPGLPYVLAGLVVDGLFAADVLLQFFLQARRGAKSVGAAFLVGLPDVPERFDLLEGLLFIRQIPRRL